MLLILRPQTFFFFEDLGRGRPWFFHRCMNPQKGRSEGLLPSILKNAEKIFLFPFLHIIYFHCIYIYIYTHYIFGIYFHQL